MVVVAGFGNSIVSLGVLSLSFFNNLHNNKHDDKRRARENEPTSEHTVYCHKFGGGTALINQRQSAEQQESLENTHSSGGANMFLIA